jgi:hypothetical protein
MRVDDEVLKVLDAAKIEGQRLMLGEQLERALYLRTDKVIKAAGGRWNRNIGAHIFDGPAAEAIEQIILSGEVTVPQDFGYFPTPDNVVGTMLALAGIDPAMQPGALVLEPSAGRGAIVSRLLQNPIRLSMVELLPTNARVLGQLRDNVGTIESLTCGDFLVEEPDQSFDFVVMNPPFAKQDDIRHVMHALKFLKPTGRLVSVMSASVRFRENKLSADFRALVVQCGGFFVELPEGSFKESGTMVNTVIVVFPAEKVE